MLLRSSLIWLSCIVVLAVVLNHFTDARPTLDDDPLDLSDFIDGEASASDVFGSLDDLKRDSRSASRRNGGRQIRRERPGTGRGTGRGHGNNKPDGHPPPRPPPPPIPSRPPPRQPPPRPPPPQLPPPESPPPIPPRSTPHEHVETEVEPARRPYQNTREHLQNAGQSLNIASDVSDTVKPQMTEIISSEIVRQLADVTGMQRPYNMDYGGYGNEFGPGYGGGSRRGSGNGDSGYDDSESVETVTRRSTSRLSSSRHSDSDTSTYDDYSSTYTEEESYDTTPEPESVDPETTNDDSVAEEESESVDENVSTASSLDLSDE